MTTYLTYVTLLHFDKDAKKEVLVSAILDLNPTTISKILKQPDGCVAIVYKDGSINKLITKFEDFVKFFIKFADINETFKEEFDSYINNNWGKN